MLLPALFIEDRPQLFTCHAFSITLLHGLHYKMFTTFSKTEVTIAVASAFSFVDRHKVFGELPLSLTCSAGRITQSYKLYCLFRRCIEDVCMVSHKMEMAAVMAPAAEASAVYWSTESYQLYSHQILQLCLYGTSAEKKR